jgi:hypothetical protein
MNILLNETQDMLSPPWRRRIETDAIGGSAKEDAFCLHSRDYKSLLFCNQI